MTENTTATTNPINLLIDAVTPTLDEAMNAYDAYTASGGTDDFATWNDKWMDEYIERKFKEELGAPVKTSTPSNLPPKPSKPSKTTNSVKANKAPKKPTKPSADGKETPPTKPAPLAKSGKIEVSLTPVEKAKREKQLLAVTETVRKEISNIATAYMLIGFQLWNVREKKLYLAADMKNVYEYTEAAFGFKSTSAKNFIAVCEKFSCKDKDGLPTDKIDPAFTMFAFTQLREMLPLSDEQISSVNSGMSSRDIKAMRSGHSSDQSDDENAVPAAKTKSVYYDGAVTAETWDRLLEKLEKLIGSGKHIQITVTE